MEVIKQGAKPNNKEYDGNCRNCGTVVKFKRSEAEYTFDQRDGDYLSVKCPTCGYKIHTSV